MKAQSKKEFLKSEHADWTYWQDYSYAEYLREMSIDVAKCKCGTYYWDGCAKRCLC